MATYQYLINRGGEITNQTTGRVYPNPQELAGDLGIAPHQIDWSQITAGGTQGGQTANPISSFNTAIMSKLKSYQGLSSADLIKRQSAILKKMYQKQSQITPEEQRVLSPTQQSAIRGGQTSALSPELEATKGQLLDRKEAQSRFLETIGIARNIGKDVLAAQESQADKALEGLKMLAYSGQPADQSQISQVASLTGYDPTALQGYYGELQRQAQSQRTLDDLELSLKKKELAKPYYKPDTIEPTVDINTTLFNVGLPLTAVTNKGIITDSKLSQLGQAGIPPTDAQEIMDMILQGSSLENVRQWMISLGVDPQILDTFMQTLQGATTTIDNPFK